MTGELSLARELLATAVLAALVVSVAAGAIVVGRRLFPADGLHRGLAVAVAAAAQVVGVPLLLGMVGLLSVGPVVIAQVGLGLAAVGWHRRHPLAGADDPAPLASTSWLDQLGLSAAAGFVTLGAVASLGRERSFDFDTKEYHLSNLAAWLQHASIWSLPYAQPGSVTATHPGNGELTGLWLALPTHGDELVYVAPVLWGVVAILAGAVLARALRPEPGRAGLGALAVVSVLAAPIYLSTQVHSLSTDLPAMAGLLAAVALLVVARGDQRVATVVLAGAALGLGLGSKYTAFVPGALIALVALLLLGWSRRWFWLVPGVVALAGPWFLRNAIATGNPLFPQELVGLSAGDTPYNLLNTSMLDQLVHGHGDVASSWTHLGARLVGPVLLVAVGGMAALVLRRPESGDPRPARVLVGLTALSFVAYLATPVTGGGPTGLAFIIASCFRYGLFAVTLAVVLGLTGLGRRLAAVAAALVLAWDAWRAAAGALPRDDLALRTPLVVGLVVAGAVLLATRPAAVALARRAPVWAGAGLAVAVVGAVGLVTVHRDDRGTQGTAIERAALVVGPHEPALVLGYADLRAVLGPRLQRHLVGVHRGGAADEVPFADEAQLRRRVLGEDTSPPPAGLAPALTRAIDASGARLLVVGYGNPLAYPDGWAPRGAWCLVAGDAEGEVLIRPELLLPGVTCVPPVAPPTSSALTTVSP